MTERITAEAVTAAMVEYDADDRAIVAGQVINFTQVGVMVSLLAPVEWELVAGYLYALIEREPIRSGRAYTAHRTVFGALAGELRGYARATGTPIGLEMDLRAATSKAEELRIRQRMADQAAAYDRHVDDVIASHHVQADVDTALVAELTEDTIDEEGQPIATPAAQDSDDDVSAWA